MFLIAMVKPAPCPRGTWANDDLTTTDTSESVHGPETAVVDVAPVGRLNAVGVGDGVVVDGFGDETVGRSNVLVGDGLPAESGSALDGAIAPHAYVTISTTRARPTPTTARRRQ